GSAAAPAARCRKVLRGICIRCPLTTSKAIPILMPLERAVTVAIPDLAHFFGCRRLAPPRLSTTAAPPRWRGRAGRQDIGRARDRRRRRAAFTLGGGLLNLRVGEGLRLDRELCRQGYCAWPAIVPCPQGGA